MKLSVIIPVRDDPRLPACLGALSRQSVEGATYEVLVIDDGPRPATRGVVAQFPARYLVNAGRGPYAARNFGIAEAQGDVVVFTDSDCLPPPHWLAAIRAVFERTAACDAAVGPSYALNTDPVGLLVQQMDDDRWSRLGREGWVTYCDTRNLAGHRDVFRKEPFDATFRHAGDIEWGIRARRRGFRILFAPDMALGHANVDSLWQVWRRGVRRGRGLAAVRRKHGPGVHISGARPFRLLGADLKDQLLWTATRPGLRWTARGALVLATTGLVGVVAALLSVPPLRARAGLPFRLLDRASLLLGMVLGEREGRRQALAPPPRRPLYGGGPDRG